MEQRDNTPAINLEDRIPPRTPVTASGLDIHGEETQGQDLEGVRVTDTYPLANFQPQSMLESGRGKEARSAIKSHTDDLGRQASLGPQAPKPQQNKENRPQDNLKGMLSRLT
ncbi:hypothetical protein VE00_05798 [Pseudogymnoascus sp. WSF 3629]|nr:hypothetical protein VE00_05798 [Pseudogymnoascus sp. WSF 3629]